MFKKGVLSPEQTNLLIREGRKATGLPLQQEQDSRAAERESLSVRSAFCFNECRKGLVLHKPLKKIRLAHVPKFITFFVFTLLWAVDIQGEAAVTEDAVRETTPSPPTMFYSTPGVSISITWDSVDDASGYILSYSPYPYAGPESVGFIDLGNQTRVTFDLWSGAAFYFSVQAYNNQGTSSYSNVIILSPL